MTPIKPAFPMNRMDIDSLFGGVAVAPAPIEQWLPGAIERTALAAMSDQTSLPRGIPPTASG